MKALVVYDSFFGNTEKIARAIGMSLGAAADVTTSRVSDLQPEQLAGATLLVVGSPTRKFRPTPAITRLVKNLAARQLEGVGVAAFDTRIDTGDIKFALLRFLIHRAGYAARPIAAGLTKSGGELLAAPEGFFVGGTEGPLKTGELERAGAWARQIAAAAAP